MSAPITLCGSLSLRPVRLGAVMHEAGYRALGLDYRYVPFAATSASLPEAVRAMRSLGIRGLGVSMPFKIEVLALIDALDPLASRIGATNTLVNDAGRITGHNTDAEGAVRALCAAAGDLDGARILVLGAGGAARAVVVGLKGQRAQVTLTNRTEASGRALANELGCSFEPLAGLGGSSCDVIVNASSAGMDLGRGPSRVPLGDAVFERRPLVMDIVYEPVDTAFLARASAAGCRTIHGAEMLLHQAARQFELYTGRAAPLAAMRCARDRELASSKG